MIKLFAVFAASLILAYISERTTISIQVSGRRYTVWKDWAYILLVSILVLLAGLRTSYNDSPLSSKRQKNICMKRHLATGAVF